MDVMELHQRAVQAWQQKVAGVPEQAWSAPTPCADWDVRALVNHVVGEERWTRPIVDGRTVAEVGDALDGDLLGEDPYAAAEAAGSEAVTAVDERVPEAGIVHLSFGDVPIEEYVRQLSADHLVHAWDLAVATGQDRRLEDDLVVEVAAWFAEREDLYRAAGVIGARPEGAGGDPQADLLAAFGRDPGP